MSILFICLLSVCMDNPLVLAAYTTRPYSVWMAESVLDRGQAIVPQSPKVSSSTYLQVGFFQTAILRLLECYRAPEYINTRGRWHEYLEDSTRSVIPFLLNATQDTQIPLDRFSTGNSLLHQ